MLIYCWWECKKSVWKILMQFIQVNPTLTKPPRNSTPVYLLKRNEHTETCAWRFRAALFTISQEWKQPKSTSRWMDKQNVYSYNGVVLSNKKQWSVIHTTTWVNLRIIMLIERSSRRIYILCFSIDVMF